MIYVRFVVATALGMPALASAHAFAERCDLPAPLYYFMTGAALVVSLSGIAEPMIVFTPPDAVISR